MNRLLVFLVAILVGVIARAEVPTDAEIEACPVAYKNPDNLKDGDLEELEKCMSDHEAASKFSVLFEARTKAVGSRDSITSKQKRAVSEAASLRKRALELASNLKKQNLTSTDQAVQALEPLKAILAQIEADLGALKQGWAAKMTFDKTSPVYELLALAKDPNATPSAINSLSKFKNSFPKAYWGEGADANQPLESVDQALLRVRDSFKAKLGKVGMLATTDISQGAVAGFSNTKQFVQAGDYHDRFIQASNADALERKYRLHVQGGVTITSQDRTRELLQVLDAGIRNAPKGLRKQVQLKIEPRKARLLELANSAKQKEVALETPINLARNLSVIGNSLKSAIPACAAKSKFLGSWAVEVTEKIAAITEANSSPVPKQHVQRARRILIEEALVEALEVQRLCREQVRS